MCQKCALIIGRITTFIHVMINRNRKPSPTTYLTFYFFLSLNWRQRLYEIHTSLLDTSRFLTFDVLVWPNRNCNVNLIYLVGHKTSHFQFQGIQYCTMVHLLAMCSVLFVLQSEVSIQVNSRQVMSCFPPGFHWWGVNRCSHHWWWHRWEQGWVVCAIKRCIMHTALIAWPQSGAHCYQGRPHLRWTEHPRQLPTVVTRHRHLGGGSHPGCRKTGPCLLDT